MLPPAAQYLQPGGTDGLGVRLAPHSVYRHLIAKTAEVYCRKAISRNSHEIATGEGKRHRGTVLVLLPGKRSYTGILQNKMCITHIYLIMRHALTVTKKNPFFLLKTTSHTIQHGYRNVGSAFNKYVCQPAVTQKRMSHNKIMKENRKDFIYEDH